MKRAIFTTATVFISSMLLAGLAVGSGVGAKTSDTSAVESDIGGEAMAASHEQMAAQPLDMNQVRELQKLLNDQGYNIGVDDGIIGDGTTAAIRQYQLDNGLANSGTPDEATLRHLSPDTEKQEFFGVAPEYGEQNEMMNKDMLDKDKME